MSTASRLRNGAAFSLGAIMELPMAVENYAPLFDKLMDHEGGYTNDPRDPGNWTGGKVKVGKLLGTKFGIAANSFPHVDIKNLTKERARELYKSLYWDKLKADQLPGGVDWAVFDFGVNSGTARAIVSLQRALGVADDGRIGPVTIAAAQKADPRKVIKAICDDRLAMLKKLKIWPTYKNGWTRRVSETRELALAMTAARPTLLARVFGRAV
jgi:lysozyme family protein